MAAAGVPDNPEHPSLAYLFRRFLRYGFLAWGGPVAQIGLMHREVVQRDGWITEERFRKTLALYQALPGPEAMELAVYFGMLKRGRLGGFLTGLAFLLPGVVLLTLLAALYVAYADTASWGEALLYGLRPAVIAMVAIALVRLTRASVTTLPLAAVALAAAAVAILLPWVNFLVLLAAGGAAIVAASSFARPTRSAALLPLAGFGLALGTLTALPAFPALFWVALKAGMLSFGGAYTAIPFLHEGVVAEHGWLTNEAFLEAFALSALVPGPLIAFATFIGYTVGGLAGALIATVAVFAPAFLITLLGHRHLDRLIEEPRLHGFLLGVTAAVMGLIAASLVPLALGAFVDPWTVGIALGAAAGFHFLKGRIPFVLAACALMGLAVRYGLALA